MRTIFVVAATRIVRGHREDWRGVFPSGGGAADFFRWRCVSDWVCVKGMKNHRPVLLPLVAFSMLLFVPSRVAAQLPVLDEDGWLGYFAGLRETKYLFGIDSHGVIMINADAKAKGPAEGVVLKIEPLVMEQKPDGSQSVKKLVEESLETADQPTSKFKQAVYRGKVTGDAQFEVTVTAERGMIFVGGRILSPGSLKNPLRFAVQANVPNLYPHLKIEDTDPKKAAKELEKKVGRDSLSLKAVDGKRHKFELVEKVDPKRAELADGVFSEVEIDSGANNGRRIALNAAPNSFFKISPKGAAGEELYRGMLVTWQADPAKDPDHKARLAVGVR